MKRKTDERTGESEVPEQTNVEAALDRLEAIVGRLEAGELTLEESLSCFEEGVRLTRNCAEKLEAAERRIEVLTREGDGWAERTLDDPATASDTEA
ncbi:MAG: exodeoxyribonuclease VII small subunit [bacterium TMED88]|nr:exodeoxyribonuclease VII small subunit [Deltaproteobacteria bacterium]OUV31758.1 MAG: exodeoxyribonuclease VII small subunit [bacterium TMED88]